MLDVIRYNKLAFFIWVMAVTVFSSAFLVTAIFDAKPCILCIYQRIPYVLIILAGLFVFLLSFFAKKNFHIRCFLVISSIGFAATCGIGLYQFGIVQSGLSEVSCAVKANAETLNSSNFGKLVESQQAHTPGCNIPFLIFGYSLAAWNALIGFILFLIAIVGVFLHKDVVYPIKGGKG